MKQMFTPNTRHNIIESDTLARNTRSQAHIHSIMDEVMLSCVQMSIPPAVRIDPRQAASRKYPMQLLCELASAVLDEETGDLLEYWQLIQHPEHQELWGAHHRKRDVSTAVSSGFHADTLTNKTKNGRFTECH